MKRLLAGTALAGALVTGVACAEGRLTGLVGVEGRYFFETAQGDRLPPTNLSVFGELEYYRALDSGSGNLAITPFVRFDEHDTERTHVDLRELLWLRTGGTWELRAGISRVFWGVTESRHLVDIINQTDAVESVDGEQKLGQPMVRLSLFSGWGTLDFYVLPYFRERVFPGEDGRPGVRLPVDTDKPRYASRQKQRHVDAAVRWSHFIGDWDFGLAHFTGTNREPRLVPDARDGRLVLVPYYDLVDRTSLDAQFTRDGWLWKLEALHQSGGPETFNAAVAGFEYTFLGVAGRATDIGLLAEYLHDGRGSGAESPYQNDIFIGLRWQLNDRQSTEALIGAIQDLDGGGHAVQLKASRRVGQQFTASLEAWAIGDTTDDPALRGLRRDGFLQLRVIWFF
ncbi:MAG: hypothetical protein WD609_11375 [Aquisalimonadaceae bacterium]